ncbi:hypothetical protein AB0L05_34725 [Nonomuraea pusilla]|uniref:hypothetical protein n=1 Tax=Nonomuraea pusilla TaxID=46177 RepID=UPI0033242449
MDTVIPAAIAAAIATLCYVSTCYARPFTRCPRCKGRRHLPNRIGRGSHDCRRCDGTGLRLRLGRRLWNHVRRLHHDA